MNYQNLIRPLKHYLSGFLLIPVFSFLFAEVYPQEYFQQEVNYVIHVKLNDKKHELSSFESVEYINKSPDTLGFIFFHLWPNAYSSNNTDLAKQLSLSKGKERLFKDAELRGYIDSLDFRVGNIKVSWLFLPDKPDICKILLNEPLYPGDTIVITTPFHVRIPKGVTSRLGHIGESYQISQWYPKPAVYDRSGWHPMPYLDQGEFYSEFGSFDVSITLPFNYTVGASGDLQSEEEIQRLEGLAKDTLWKTASGYLNDDFPASSLNLKTLRYTGSGIHDFAWFADKRFHVMKGKVKLPESGREVITFVMFTNKQADLWKSALEYVNSSISYFSERIGDYPYSTCTAVQSALNAGAGMEYPGITVIGLANDAYSLNEVITHEICHNWFYSALGTDERRYPFMDEGITSAYEEMYMNDRYPGKKLWELLFKREKIARLLHIDRMPEERLEEIDWLVPARQNLEQPINLSAPDYTTLNYSSMIYSKASIGFNYLRQYLGDSVFDSAMHDYYITWRSKHPGPEDLRKIFESHAGKDLTWFFTDFLGTTKRIDYKILRLDGDKVLIRNSGELISPLIIGGVVRDSVYFDKWVDGFKGERWIDIPGGNYSEVMIDPDHLMTELYRSNNNIHKRSLFRKTDPVSPQLLLAIEDPGKRTLIYMPSVNWTRENGFMLGVALNNGLLIPKRIEYSVVPFYSFKDPGIVGSGKIAFNIMPYENIIRIATLSFEGAKFGAPGDQNYYKEQIGLDITFRTGQMTDPVTQKASAVYIGASDLNQILNGENADMRSYFRLGYAAVRKGLVNPFSLSATYEMNNTFQKASTEINYRYSYWRKSSGLDMRLYAGAMIRNVSTVPFYAISPAGRSGREQYLYQGTYPDRFGVFPSTLGSRQMTLSEGGLVSPVNDSLGYSRWLISLSLSSNLPGKASRIGIKPFINILINDHGAGNGNNSPLFFEAGLKAGFWNFFEVYIPLLVSGNIESSVGIFKNRIRIILNLDSFLSYKLTR